MRVATPPRARPRPRPRNGEVHLPSDAESEIQALGCVLMAADHSRGEALALLDQLTSPMFWDGRVWELVAMAKEASAAGHSPAVIVLAAMLRDKGHESGPVLLQEAADSVPGIHLFPTIVGRLKELALRRWAIAKADELSGLAGAPTVSLEDIRGRLGELFEAATTAGRARKPLTVWSLEDARGYVPPSGGLLIGEADVFKGTEGLTVFAGPPGSGKSLALDSLALAGAIGSGYWMGRKVHRRFRTLIVQCENGAARIKGSLESMAEAHPEADVEGSIRISLPPDGGLPFANAEFRRELAATIERHQIDVVGIDPWTALGVEDTAQAVVEALIQIRSCLPGGDACPALVIVAHTRKPRAETAGRRGRSMMYDVSGSQALVASARCVYVLNPFTDDIQDDRILWSCAKLSNSDRPPADSVWHRRKGDLFGHCDDDPEEYFRRQSEGDDRVWLRVEHVQELLEDGRAMTQNRLAKELADRFNDGKGSSTAHRWLARPEFRKHLADSGGLLSWKP